MISYTERPISTLRYRMYSNLKYSSTATIQARMGQEIVNDEQCSEIEQNSLWNESP